MKRKVYTSARERKTDQLIGGGVFILVNIILWLVILLLQGWPQTRSLSPPGNGQTTTLILLLPWLVNGVVFLLALIFRPQIAVGYIALPGLILFAGIWLGVLFVGACVAGLVVGLPFGQNGGPVLFIVFFGLLIAGGIWSLIKAVAWTGDWWSSGDEPPGGTGA